MNGENQSEKNEAASNWDSLDKWGIVALQKHRFDLDGFAVWLTTASSKYDNWAVHPFTGEALPWSLTTLMCMRIETIFEVARDEREIFFEPIVLVFKDAESKCRFDELAESKALF